MRITRISATWLHVPIPAERQHVSDYGRATSFDSTLVRVETDSGITGFGEARGALPSTGNCASLVTHIERDLGPMLVGQDPRDISRLWEVMYNGARAHFALARGHVFPVLGRRGLNLQAMSGIDMALWDILGKSLDAPVWRLLGGRRQARMPAYASGGWAPPERIADELRGYIERGGFKAVKMRVGSADGTLQMSIARVRAARSGLGDDVDIFCDAHGTWTVAEARQFCRAVEDCRIGWLEEPVTGDDKPGMAQVRAGTSIPIAAGECEMTRFDFRDLVEQRAVDILQPDLAICGGISEGLRIEALASAHQLRFAPHLWGGALLFASGMHLASVAASGFILEYSLGANPLLHELAQEPLEVVDGCIDIPDRPGLGVGIDEQFVRRYAMQ